ncbi:MAG: glycosyltransferase [Flavobacteriales bacterium]
MKSITVSIILPFHGRCDFLDEAIESIIQQSFTDWELILVENQADAHTVKKVEDYLSKDLRIRLLHEPTKGISCALNTGLEAAQGKYIARLDADDIAHPTRLEKQFRYLENHPQCGLVSCQTTLFPASSSNEGYQLFVDWQKEIISHQEHAENIFIESPIAHPSVMFRNSLIKQYGNYSTDHIPEDYELWLRWMSHGVKFYKLPEELLLWRDRPDRLSRTHSAYDTLAFDRVKVHYLAKYLKNLDLHHRPIIVCGTGKNSLRRAKMLEDQGIPIYAHTDVKQKTNKVPFLSVRECLNLDNAFFINFISERNVKKQVAAWLEQQGKNIMTDYILAG